MNFGLIIVGDEILSGKRRDAHLAKVIELLAERGLALAWARYVRCATPSAAATWCFPAAASVPRPTTTRASARPPPWGASWCCIRRPGR
jgi:hypothetical protein